MKIQKLQQVTSQDEHLQHLQQHIIRDWPEHRNQIPQHIRPYWTFCDNMAMINMVILKGKCVVIPKTLQRQALEQLHVNHMEISKN